MIKILDKSKEKLCLVTDMSETLANAIRRAVLEILVLAIDEVEFLKNDSALYDEMIAHRLGLIPLKTEKTMIEKDKCSCKGKGCMKCTVELKIRATGLKTVYASDLKGKATVVYGKMPIVILKEGQELELIARAILGRGREHAKFSPGLVYYRHVNEIEGLKDIEKLRKCLLNIKEKFYFLEKKQGSRDVYITDADDGALESCNDQEFKVRPSENIIFFIESFGQLGAKNIFLESISALNKSLKELSKQVK